MAKIPFFIFAIVTAVAIMGGVNQNDVAHAQTTHQRSSLGKILNALTAGPQSIRNNATVLDWDFTVLRAGSNNWTCLPDDPHSPGNDPICADHQSLLWFQAYMKGESPHITQPGVAYMLRGGSEASNTDPFATEPPAGQNWMRTPPHIMIFPVGTLDTSVYGTNMDNGGPWIMWANTPYQHLMIPVKSH